MVESFRPYVIPNSFRDIQKMLNQVQCEEV
jgi:hypothetical protein